MYIRKCGDLLMDEFEFINSIKQADYKNASLIKGVGDDAAVFRQTNQDIVTAVDTFVENVHFSKQTMPLFFIGYRALAANISDMAAMGAKPVFYLASITIPSFWPMKEVQEVFSGLDACAKEYEMDLIGGDTVSGKELTLSVTIIGYVDKGKARYRNQAKIDDIVFVTGTLGDSRAGLELLLDGKTSDSENHFFINRHQKPTPRVGFSIGLSDLCRVSLNDVSDGIANEAAEIAEASCVNIIIEDEFIPVSDSFSQFPKALQYNWKYFGGEDFELLGTASEENYEYITEIGRQTDTKVTRIGYVKARDSSQATVMLKKNKIMSPLNKEGYTHLK